MLCRKKCCRACRQSSKADRSDHWRRINPPHARTSLLVQYRVCQSTVMLPNGGEFDLNVEQMNARWSGRKEAASGSVMGPYAHTLSLCKIISAGIIASFVIASRSRRALLQSVSRPSPSLTTETRVNFELHLVRARLEPNSTYSSTMRSKKGRRRGQRQFSTPSFWSAELTCAAPN